MKKYRCEHPTTAPTGKSALSAKIAVACLAGMAAVVLIAPCCMAETQIGAGVQVATGTPPEIQLGAGLEHGTLLRGSTGDTYMVVDVTGAAVAQAVTRPPMSVSLVIDRSGSMSGPKMQNAITAASSFIQNLSDGDVVSIYGYDNVVEQLAPPTPVNAATRPALFASVARLHPRGSTNLHGGLMAGIASLNMAGAERPVRRVILISDGLANVGPSSAHELGAEAARAARMGISVTSIGVGMQYSEAVLGSLAGRSGGRFYHLQEPSQMAAIMQSELQALTRTVARNVLIDVVPAPGVQFIGATGADVVQNGNQIQLRLGDIIGGNSMPVVVQLRVPTSGSAPARDAARVNVAYVAASNGASRRATTNVRYSLAGSQAQVDSSLNPNFVLAIEQHQASLAQQQAAALLEQGQSEQAAAMLDQHAARMDRRARALPAAQAQELSRRAGRVRSAGSNARRARSRPARRAASLRMNDDALDGLNL